MKRSVKSFTDINYLNSDTDFKMTPKKSAQKDLQAIYGSIIYGISDELGSNNGWCSDLRENLKNEQYLSRALWTAVKIL